MSQTLLLKKKNDILTPIHNAIKALVKMGEVAAKLEYTITENDADRFKRQVKEFKHDYVTPLETMAAEIKAGIVTEKNNKELQKLINYDKNKKQKNKKHDTDNAEL